MGGIGGEEEKDDDEEVDPGEEEKDDDGKGEKEKDGDGKGEEDGEEKDDDGTKSTCSEMLRALSQPAATHSALLSKRPLYTCKAQARKRD